MKQKVQHQIREISHQWDDITQHSNRTEINCAIINWDGNHLKTTAVLHVICPLQCCTSCPEDCWNQGRKWPSLRCNSPNSHLPHPLEPRILDRTREIWPRKVLSSFIFLPDGERLHLYNFLSQVHSKEKAKRPAFYHMLFGWGPRNCIGKRFALMEANMALIKVIKKYTFVQAPEKEVSFKLFTLTKYCSYQFKLCHAVNIDREITLMLGCIRDVGS